MSGIEKAYDSPTRKDWIRTFYTFAYISLLILIIVSGIIRYFQAPAGNVQESKQEQSSNSEKVKESKVIEKDPTVTSLVLKPLAESPKAKIIFEHVGYFLILLFLFILIPIPLLSVKRFKFMTLEVERESQAIEVAKNLTIQQDKFGLLSYWLKEDFKSLFLEVERDNTSYKDFLEEMLFYMRDHYKNNWDSHFEFDIVTETKFKQNYFAPKLVKKSLPSAKVKGIGLPINKENDRYIHFKNFMIHTINVEENLLTEEECLITYVIVLKSYRTIFDEYDGHLVSGLASLTYELYRRYHTSLAIQEEEDVESEEEIK
ncbi:hypothetical protein QNH26_23290 [Peribacillus frigoritolerans]|uniref:hypothetical protein n=1 Tax=Peribacillus frigoritolerans TaxID=450367 RepID=UPI0024C1BE36|nr:hypothetical protein [Peribacillus frigoritolerans]WHX66534.1 hypothetical protein QNH26_23290 [Peribacillus frigoritolerans]